MSLCRLRWNTFLSSIWGRGRRSWRVMSSELSSRSNHNQYLYAMMSAEACG
jgi:hypothetical protein